MTNNVADKKTRQARLAICKACPSFQNNKYKELVCGECQCSLKMKISRTTSRCPLYKWREV